MSPASIRLTALSGEFLAPARELASRLGLPVELAGQIAPGLTPLGELQLGPSGLQFLAADTGGPVRVDFVGGAMAHRRLQGGGSGQMIARAVGIQPGIRPTILDCTAGLGRDAFVLASLGCEIHLIERHPLVAALLADGLQRARLDPETAIIVERMHLQQGNAIDLLQAWSAPAPQVIFVDPMFPERQKSALVKKEMRAFRPLVGDDDDAPQLLAAALALASHRVVVKRPRKAPTIPGASPGYTLEGKASRFDIYPKQALRK